MNAAARFRVGLSRDILAREWRALVRSRTARAARRRPANRVGIPAARSLDEITPDIMARYDGLYVNSPRVTAASVAGGDLRVKIVARHGVGYDSVDVPALAARA